MNDTNKNNNKTHLNSLKIVHWNSFKMTISKCEELNEFIKKNNPDIMSLNEVKMNHEEANYYLNFNNYKTFHKPREKNSRYGGGVALIIKNSIDHTESNILEHLNLETKEIKISTTNCNFTIVT